MTISPVPIRSLIVLAGLLAIAMPVIAADPAPLPPEAPADWWSAVQQAIRLQEYELSRVATAPGEPEAWSAPNRAQGLRSRFSTDGIRVEPRDRSEDSTTPAFEWGLELVAWGRTGALSAPGEARPGAEGNRFELVRDGFTEWYLNDDRGVEQGFEIASPPGGSGTRSGPLVIDMALSGTLRPVFAEDGQAVDFTLANGGMPVLRYGGLKVTDATGQTIRAHLEGVAALVSSDPDAGADRARGGGIRIVIDDAAAIYPLSVDPLIMPLGWLAAGEQASANFGISVGTAGDVNGDGYSDVIVGANLYSGFGRTDAGAAWVYLGSASGLSPGYAWFALGDHSFAGFGSSVGTAGDVNGDGYSDVIVGAFVHGQNDEGGAFVYHGGPSGLSSTPAWTAEGDAPNEWFGWAVGTAGDVNGDGYSDVIVGVRAYSNGQTGEGAAVVYHGSPSGLASTPAWAAESNQAGAIFGISVGTAGDVNGDGYSDVIVGAYLYDNGEGNEGAAFVFHGGPSGLSPTSAWVEDGDQEFARFGTSVGTAGDVNGDGYSDVVVGAPEYDGGETGEGRAFVYLGSASGLAASPWWTAESDQANASFGESVATAGDVNGDGYSDVIVGAPYYDDAEIGQGRVEVYLGSASGLARPQSLLTPSDANAHSGLSVGTAGDVNGDGYSDVIFGAPGTDAGETDEGAALVFLGGASGPSVTSGWTAESDQGGAYFGASVASAGDVNGDGYSDVIVGADRYDNGESDEGAAWVYHGSPVGLSATPAWAAESDQAGALFGVSTGKAGDVNGDGYSDVIVGAFYYDNGEFDEGAAWVYHGSPVGLSATPAWTAESNQALANFGVAVGTAGDVNGDGYSDVIVGADHYDNGAPNEGAAWVYLGSPSGLSATPAWTAEGDDTDDGFGRAVGTAGDVNGDGYSDVIVGVRAYDSGEAGDGAAVGYHGSPSGLASTPAWTAESNQPGANFGVSVGTAGDVNGDGYSDVIVGADLYDNGALNEGAVFVYLGSPSGLSASTAWFKDGNRWGARFGFSVASAGDVNGDGYSDVIVGTPYYDEVSVGEYTGAAWVYLGSPSGLSTSPTWFGEAVGETWGDGFGTSVGTAGDVNGDGYSDVIVGAAGPLAYGEAFLYYGNDGPGIALRPRQLRADGSAPIAPLGLTADGQFRLAAGGRSPFGRGRTKLEWQIAPLGGTFATAINPPQSLPFFTDTGAPSVTGGLGAPLDHTVVLDGPPGNEGGPYLWRLRNRYDPVTNPFLPAGPWLTPVTSALTETDLRRLEGSCTLGDRVWWDAEGDGIQGELDGGAGWSLGEGSGVTTADEFGTNDGLLVGGASWTAGKYGNGVELDGSTGYIDTTVDLDVGDSVSIGFWVRVDSVAGNHAFASKHTSGGNNLFIFGQWYGGYHVRVRGDTTTGGTPTTGWHHLVAVLSDSGPNTDVTIYEDGVEIWSDTLTDEMGDVSGKPWVFGQEWDAAVPSDFLDGVLDEIFIVDRALSAAEVAHIHTYGWDTEFGASLITVYLFSAPSDFVATALTDATGRFSFSVPPGDYRLVITPPPDATISPRDQGGDDARDSDADPSTGWTDIVTVAAGETNSDVDFGLHFGCLGPDEPVWIYEVTLSDPDGYPTLHFQDPNQPSELTGYNVYRSDNPSLPPATWPKVAGNVVDMDAGTPNIQWTDTSGDVPPSGTWFYQVTAYNSTCTAEGPF